MKWSFLIFLISTPPPFPLLPSNEYSLELTERDIQPQLGNGSTVTGFKQDLTIMEPQAWTNLLQSISCTRAVSEKFVILGKRLCSWLLIISALVWYHIFVCIEEALYFFQTSSFLQLCWILSSSSSLLPLHLSKITFEFTMCMYSLLLYRSLWKMLHFQLCS